MKRVIVLVFIFSISCLVFSNTSGSQYGFYFNNYNSTGAAGQGYTGVASRDDLSFSNINPASFEVKKKYQIFYEYSNKSSIDYMYINPSTENTEFTPYKTNPLFGFGFSPIKNLNIGLTTKHPSSYKVGDIIFFVVDETGETIQEIPMNQKTSVTGLAIPINYTLFDKITLGVEINFLKHIEYYPILFESYNGLYLHEGKNSYSNNIFRFGFVADIYHGLSAGFSLTEGYSHKDVLKFSDISDEIKYEKEKHPGELVIGLKYASQKIPIEFLFDYRYIDYSLQDYYKASNSIHTGITYSPFKSTKLKLGYFTQPDNRDKSSTYTYNDDDPDNDVPYWLDDDFAQQFLTFGVDYSWYRLSFKTSYMTSSVLSDGEIEMSYFKFSTIVNF